MKGGLQVQYQCSWSHVLSSEVIRENKLAKEEGKLYDNNWNVLFPDSRQQADNTKQGAEISGNNDMVVGKVTAASENNTVEHKQQSVVCNIVL
jgi:hypothetical protein